MGGRGPRGSVSTCTLPGAEGSQPPGKKEAGGWGPGVGASQPWYHTQSHPFNRQETWDPKGPAAHGVCELLSRPPHSAKQEMAQKSRVSPLQLSTLNTKPCPLSSPGVSPRIWARGGGAAAANLEKSQKPPTQVRTEGSAVATPPSIFREIEAGALR